MSAGDVVAHSTPPSSYTPSVPQPGTPDSITTKRGLFGRKKKSAVNLNGTPSLSSLNGNDSVESFDIGADDSGLPRKAVRNVFKRRAKAENPSAGSSIDDRNGTGDGEEHDEDKDTVGSLSPTDDEQDARSAGLLSTPPAGSSKISKPRLFGRRSTSPLAPVARATTSLGAMGKPQSKETRSVSAEMRPATAGGDPRPSQERSRGVRGLSVSTPNARGEFPTAPKPAATASTAPKLGHVVESSGLSSRPVAIQETDMSDAPKTTITPPTPTAEGAHFPLNTTNTPSKLSQSVSNSGDTTNLPQENQINPPGSAGGGGFFQTMFSAAQNAATSLTNNIPLNLANAPGAHSRSDSEGSKNSAQATGGAAEGSQEKEREPAVKTLGKGELNLASLGIVPDPLPTTQTDGTQATAAVSRTRHGRGNGSGEDGYSDRPQSDPQSALSVTSGFETSGESPVAHRTPYAEDTTLLGSTGPARSTGNRTPDRNSLTGAFDDEEDASRKKPASVRSGEEALGPPKRLRGSSAASQGTFAPVPKPTGFAVASKKRNRDFHNLFKSVPEDDYLIEDYGCALQKEILLQGRLYVSEGHLCFYSNILGWVTTLVISFDEVMSVEKKSTALLFPNAIVIQTLHARHIFASFISRDSTYDLIVGLWNVGHPQIVAGNGEAHLDGTTAAGESGDEDDDEYEEDSDDDLGESFTDAGDGPFVEEENGAGPSSKVPSRKPSQLPLNGAGAAAADSGDASGAAADFPGPKTHAPTTCDDNDKHYDKSLCDEVLPAPLGRIYSLLFGTASYPFISTLLTDEEKVLELAIPNNGEWAEVDGKKQRNFSYVKPLTGGIGPSKTRCLITETIDHFDLEKHVSVTVSTQTPDVPSGGVFSVKTRYCLMWGEGNGTRILCNCTVEWTGKSWIKGPIESGASSGQIAYNKTLLAALRREIAPKRAAAPSKPGKNGKAKKRRDTSARGTPPPVAAPAPPPVSDSWGVLEPLKPVLGPVVDVVKPLLPANFGVVLVTVLVTWIVATQLRPPQMVQAPASLMVSGGQQEKYWDEKWRQEEEGLWEWLEDRVGLDTAPQTRQRGFERSLREKTAGSAMKQRQMEEAIGVLKERLEIMERVMEKEKKGDEL